MESIELLVNDIDKKKTLATSDPGENPTNYNVKLGHIKRAKIDLEVLYLEYRKEVQSRALFVIATGTQAKKYAELAEEEFYCYKLDSDGFYNDLIDGVHERLYNSGQTASPALFDILGSTFEDKAQSIGIIGYPALIFESKYKKVLQNKGDLLKLTKRAFNEKVGSEVLGLDAIEKISKMAINNEDLERRILKKFPIIMVTEDESLVKDLAKGLSSVSGNVFIVGTGTVKDKSIKDNCLLSVKTVNKTSVEKSLIKVNENSK